MMRNLAASLIEHEIIKTTVEKAKELRRFLEPLITKSKSDNLHSRRVVLSKLDSKEAVKKLFNDLGPRFAGVNGGYLRIIKAGFRYGDNAPMAIIEFVDRDVEAKRVDKKKKDQSEITENKDSKKESVSK